MTSTVLPATLPAVLPAGDPRIPVLLRRDGLDPAAAAYIAAIESDGVTVSATQKAALDAFYKAGKSAGWYAALKRLYLPIWAAPAPNARCLVSGTNGTFVSGTHGAGTVALNGANEYFDSGFKPRSGGILNSSAWFGGLRTVFTAASSQEGAFVSTTEGLILVSFTNGFRSEIADFATGRDTSTILNANRNGIAWANRRAGVTRHRVLKTSGIVATFGYTHADSGTVPDINFFFGARNNSGTPNLFRADTVGAWWIGNGVADDLDESFAAALKTLWETCTGLTLP